MSQSTLDLLTTLGRLSPRALAALHLAGPAAMAGRVGAFEAPPEAAGELVRAGLCRVLDPTTHLHRLVPKGSKGRRAALYAWALRVGGSLPAFTDAGSEPVPFDVAAGAAPAWAVKQIRALSAAAADGRPAILATRDRDALLAMGYIREDGRGWALTAAARDAVGGAR